jgi:glycosyltransferase involved in cell wall biosynthesis
MSAMSERGVRAMRTAIFSTFPPRACGIGTFSSDLRGALLDAPDADDVRPIVVVDEPSSPQRDEVLATVSQFVRGDYTRAARLLSHMDVDVVLLQHEFGIFGGEDGDYVLSFARGVAQPLVVTLHTLLSEPSGHQLEVLTALCDRAERVIVMTETAQRVLVELGACDAEKVRVVPHGAPAVLARRREELAAGSGPRYVAPMAGGYDRLRHRFLLSTFGLLSAGKGIETMLEAMPAIIERHPEALYLIAGRTHPQVLRHEGEAYRAQLERKVVALGLEDHVDFDDRFLSIEELADLLAVTDVFVTPYRNKEQIASGALTFAIAAGCAVVSTPYWYAEDILSSGAGRLVPFGDAATLATTVSGYISDPVALALARAEARRVGAELAWSAVGHATADVLAEAASLAQPRVWQTSVDLHLIQVRTDHLHTLVDDVGIIQHADGVIPNRRTGYCVDDVARLAVVARDLERRDGDARWTPVLHRAVAFLADATDHDGAGMRNFMAYDRRWLDEPHVGDHVGRSVRAIGELLSTAWVAGLADPSRRLLRSLVRSLEGEVSLRTAAYASIGLARLDADRMEERGRRVLHAFVDQLMGAYERAADDGWRWFEDRLAYDNAALPHALIVAGHRLGQDDAVEVGLRALRWLGDECGLAEGELRLVGHDGRARTEPAPGRGDEQPLDACAFVEAELAAFSVTGDDAHAARACTAFEWFLGRNRLDRPLYDFATGGCSDGLGSEDLNGNEGAESTLAFHRAQTVIEAAALPVRTTPALPTAVSA